MKATYALILTMLSLLVIITVMGIRERSSKCDFFTGKKVYFSEKDSYDNKSKELMYTKVQSYKIVRKYIDEAIQLGSKNYDRTTNSVGSHCLIIGDDYFYGGSIEKYGHDNRAPLSGYYVNGNTGKVKYIETGCVYSWSKDKIIHK